MRYTDNPVADYDSWDAEQAKAEQQLPICDHCTEYIHGEDYYDIDGTVLCPECLDSYYKKNTDDYLG